MKEVDSFEKKIDSILIEGKIHPKSSKNVTAPSGLTYSHFQILRERYLNAGWGEVKWNSDQREGTWITFDTLSDRERRHL
jgi:hypothetical protein